jgi:polysaccharide biosynthesis transport protein
MNVMTLKRQSLSDEDAGDQTPVREAVTAERPPILVQYLSIVRRRKWVILGCIVGALIVGLVITLLSTPQYRATATLEIQRETRNFTMVEGAQPNQETSSVTDMEFYQTQYGLLQSRVLSERVVTVLRLYDDPNFFSMFGDAKAKDWFTDGRPNNAATREIRVTEAGQILLNHFAVSPERQSRLVAISFTSPDPGFSQQVINTWSENFIRSTMDRRVEATAYARHFLEERLNQLRGRIDESERQLVDYAAREGIVNLPASQPAQGDETQPGERSLVADDLATLNRELSRATADRVRAESRLGSQGGSATEGLENPAIGGLRQRRAETAAEYARMLVQFQPDYPPAVALRQQIGQLDQAIAREEGRVRQSIQETYRSSTEREGALRTRVDQLKSDLLDLRRRSIQYNIFQREADTNRELYNALLQRYKEIGVAGGVGPNNISVVDPAELPDRPYSPKLLLNLLAALLLGTLLGAGIAFALEQIDQGIADPADLEKVLGVPLLGTVPKVAGDEPIHALEDRKSMLSEAYVSLQTNLAFSTDHGIPRSLAVTSTRPAEGKTTTSTALAISIARNGRRVLLVDVDMRSPSIHSIMGLSNTKGLSNYLAGADDLDAMLFETRYKGLSVMPAGPQPPSSPELLGSDRFEKLVTELYSRFDHIVYDSPPVMGLADAPLVCSRAEGTVFVIEAHSTQRSMAQVAIQRLISANAHLVGAVLTKFDTKRAHYGYGYDYGYGYGYGTRGESQA